MTILSRTLDSLQRRRSRLAGAVSFTDRDDAREVADLAAIRDARPLLPDDDSRRTSVRNKERFAVKYAASGGATARVCVDPCGATTVR